jgi:hypothetical protein
MYHGSMLAALLVIQVHGNLALMSEPQQSLGINYHLDYELDQTGSMFKDGKESVETGNLRHDLGIQDGQERYTYDYKYPGNGGKSTLLVLTADKKQNKYSVVGTVDGGKSTVEEGKEAYDNELGTTRHSQLAGGEAVNSEEVQKTIAGVPCTRIEIQDFIISEGKAIKCIYWYPVDAKKRKRVGWLEAEKYTRVYPAKSFELDYHCRTTRIRFGFLTPAEGG